MIIVDQIPADFYQCIANKAVHYAIISVPFTINRMKVLNLENRILNIAKGKLAEMIFETFAVANDLDIDFSSGQTPYYQADRFDFWLNGKPWDIKNNFLFHEGAYLTVEEYQKLPALVPNRHNNDQWSKRETLNYLFTFLKLGDARSSGKTDAFLKLNLVKQQLELLQFLSDKYQGESQKAEPFPLSWFWKKWEELGSMENAILNSLPQLVITGYSTNETAGLFKNTEGRTFLNAALKTRIKNATCPIAKLPPFERLFPKLQQKIILGRRL